jgi:hypothetical protein
MGVEKGARGFHHAQRAKVIGLIHQLMRWKEKMENVIIVGLDGVPRLLAV